MQNAITWQKSEDANTQRKNPSTYVLCRYRTLSTAELSINCLLSKTCWQCGTDCSILVLTHLKKVKSPIIVFLPFVLRGKCGAMPSSHWLSLKCLRSCSSGFLRQMNPLLLSQVLHRDLDWKWSSWTSDCTWHSVMASGALPITPQYPLSGFIFKTKISYSI